MFRGLPWGLELLSEGSVARIGKNRRVLLGSGRFRGLVASMALQLNFSHWDGALGGSRSLGASRRSKVVKNGPFQLRKGPFRGQAGTRALRTRLEGFPGLAYLISYL